MNTKSLSGKSQIHNVQRTSFCTLFNNKKVKDRLRFVSRRKSALIITLVLNGTLNLRLEDQVLVFRDNEGDYALACVTQGLQQFVCAMLGMLNTCIVDNIF